MTRRMLLVGLLAATLASACGGSSPIGPGPTPEPPPPSPPPPTPSPVLGITRILSFGDSMTAGTTSPQVTTFRGLTAGLPQSYPFKLQELAATRYASQTITVLNAGRAGENATTGRNRLAGDLSEARPDLLIILEGANDLNFLFATGKTDVGPVVNAIEDMVREAQFRNITVMVATLPPQRTGTGKANDPDMLSEYNRDLRNMAGRKGAILVDVNALLPLSAIGQDGLHPTEEGYRQLAQIFLDAIAAKWEKPGEPTSVSR